MGLFFRFCPWILQKFYKLRNPSDSQNAPSDPRNQGLPPEGQKEGRQECQDQEESRQRQVQGPMLQVPLHLGCPRQGEGREVEAISAPRSPSQGTQVKSWDRCDTKHLTHVTIQTSYDLLLMRMKENK